MAVSNAREAYHGVLARARELDLPVAGHVPAAISVAEAVAAGQSSIKHLRSQR